MSTTNRVVAILQRLIELAESSDDAERVAKTLKSAKRYFENDPEDGARLIKGMFGGVGSLNDTVLYGSGQPLIEENNKFHALLSELFNLCLELTSFGHLNPPDKPKS